VVGFMRRELRSSSNRSSASSRLLQMQDLGLLGEVCSKARKVIVSGVQISTQVFTPWALYYYCTAAIMLQHLLEFKHISPAATGWTTN
jgi:hypothetical protein